MRIIYPNFLVGICVQLVFVWSTYAQTLSTFSPEPLADTIPPHIERTILARLASDQSSVNESNAKVATYLKQLYKNRADHIIATFNNGYFMTESSISPYLQAVLDHIYDTNPSLSKETRVFAYRSDAVNAVSFGEGTIGFSLGLLARLEHEGQLAFILCHELAHYHQRHGDQRLRQLAQLRFDRELNQKAKQIARNDYEKVSRLAHLKATLAGQVTRHGREHEFEADSLALDLFFNTGYELACAVRVMELLDAVDANGPFADIDFKRAFDFPEYPFKENWLAVGSNNYLYASRTIPDSLRTHPDCSKRAQVLRRRTEHHPSRSSIPKDPRHFQELITRSRYELAASLYQFGEYGKALYHFLMLAETNRTDPYVNAMIATSLYRLYEAQKNHRLSGAIDHPDPRFPPQYNRFLNFIHALRTSELAALGYWSAVTRKQVDGDNELILYTSWLVSNTESTRAQRDIFKEEYKARFPNGRFLDEMKRIN